MSWKGTLALLALALAALLILFSSGHSRTRSATEPLLAIHPSEVTMITIREGGGETLLNKTNGIWRIGSGSLTGSDHDRVDDRLVHALLDQAANVTPLDILNPSDLKGSVSLESLDLKTPKRSLTFLETGSGAGKTIAFGIEGPAKGQIYARLEGEKTVCLIPSEVVSTAFLHAEEFRDRRLTSLDPERLEEITLTKGSSLQRLSLKKAEAGWNLTSPMRAQGNDKAIVSWAAGLFSSKVDHWMPGGTDPSACGLDAPVAVISASESAGNSSVTMSIGSTVPGSSQSHYVRCSDRPGICVVQGLDASLEVTPSTLRSRQPKPLHLDAIDTIEIRRNDQSGTETAPLVMTRKKGSDDWEITGGGAGTLTRAAIETWFEKLQSLTASSFEPATPQRLESTGLNHPTRLRFIAHLSENTAEEAAGDLVLAEYAFGTPRDGIVAFREGTSSDLMILPESAAELTKGPEAASEVLNR